MLRRQFGREVDRPGETPAHKRRVDEPLGGHGLERRRAPAGAQGLERGAEAPVRGQRHARRDCPRVLVDALRQEDDVVPRQEREVRRGAGPVDVLAVRAGGHVIEADGQGTVGRLDMEGEEVDRVARPGEAVRAVRELEPDDIADRPGRPVLARDPARENERARAGLPERQHFGCVEDAARRVGQVDGQRHAPRGLGVGASAGRRSLRRARRRGARRAGRGGRKRMERRD